MIAIKNYETSNRDGPNNQNEFNEFHQNEFKLIQIR